ncbi:myeloid differentiation primary response protein MyD88-like [Crassostrea virginica]|uniref:Myeloid differentiation primary response protein MyD88-like n=1 Tax=Crassostrea virginica TaxID=6565 RepID=A0A8B8DWU3_CRAVI|nr:myeloid differentiation primary response protein MyD88-like [Crassostrea virginica]
MSMSEMEILDTNGESISLDDKYKAIPLDALRVSARKKLSLYLNVQSEIVNDTNGLVSDYNGLAEMVGFGFLEIKEFERQKNPTDELLTEWTNRPDLAPTIGKLWEFLVELGRLDVLQDCKNLIIRDADNYIRMVEEMKSKESPVQEDWVTSTETAIDHDVDEIAILCKDDVEKGTPQYFDAFICYSPQGEDLTFVKEMITKLENPPHNLKLFVPWRDDLPGGSRYVIDARLIEMRCKRMVIIMSRNYQNSAAADFQVKFAHALSPGARSKKLIPVLIESGIQVPQVLRHVTLCDYTKQDLKDWFWDRLSKAIKAPLDPQNSGYGTKAMTSPSSSSSLSSASSSKPSSDISSGGLGFHAGSNANVRQELSELCHLPASQSSASISSTSSADGQSYTSRGSAPHPSSDPMEHIDITSMGPDSMVKKSRKEKKTSFFPKNIFNKFKSSGSNNTSSHC